MKTIVPKPIVRKLARPISRSLVSLIDISCGSIIVKGPSGMACMLTGDKCLPPLVGDAPLSLVGKLSGRCPRRGRWGRTLRRSVFQPGERHPSPPQTRTGCGEPRGKNPKESTQITVGSQNIFTIPSHTCTLLLGFRPTIAQTGFACRREISAVWLSSVHTTKTS